MIQPSRMLKRPSVMTQSYTAPSQVHSCDTHTADVASELMNAAISFHKLHLKVQGMGSFAAHKALGDLYESLPGHADTLVESYQGAAELLLSFGDCCSPKTLNSVEEAIIYIKELCMVICQLQSMMPYSEIVNDLDTIKSTLNSAKYKLLFLK